MIDVVVKSKSAGSNPGGKTSIMVPGKDIVDAYLKYCNNTRLSREVPLCADHQPVYEALTCALLRQLGPATPETGLVRNVENVNFIYLPGFDGKELNPKKPFYFTSKLLAEPEGRNDKKAIELLKQDKLYRDLLILADVSGRRQNIYFPQDESRIVYLDIGCSFVDCHGGDI